MMRDRARDAMPPLSPGDLWMLLIANGGGGARKALDVVLPALRDIAAGARAPQARAHSALDRAAKITVPVWVPDLDDPALDRALRRWTAWVDGGRPDAALHHPARYCKTTIGHNGDLASPGGVRGRS